MSHKSFIFDLDGTLLDTAGDLTDSMNYILDKYGYPRITVENTKKYAGNGAANYLSLCLKDGFNTVGFEGILAEYRERYTKNNCLKTKPYPGVLEALDTLKARSIKMAIVSNKPDNSVKRLSDLFFREYMLTALGEKKEIARKPAPNLVFMALEQMGCSADDCLYVGDSEVDIETAKNSGMDCICVSWGFRGADVLLKNGAEIIIDDASELLKFV